MWKCPRCETINEGDFCAVCGEARPNAPQQSASAGNNAGRHSEPEQDYYRKTENAGGYAYTEAPAKRNNGLIIAVVICSTVIVAMLLGIGTYIFISRGDEEPAAESKVTATAGTEQAADSAAELQGDAAEATPSMTATPAPTPTPRPKDTLAADAEKTPVTDGKTEKREEFLSRAEAIERYSSSHFETAGPQAELNRESGIVYNKWDDLLNDVYQYLKTTLPSDKFSAIKSDELAWIKEKEAAIDAAGAQWAGGSGEPMARNCAGIDYTSKRCYYLISLIK